LAKWFRRRWFLELPVEAIFVNVSGRNYQPSIDASYQVQASTLTYFVTCPFGQLTKKSTRPTQSFSCPKKLIKITKTRE
jgi:hypothetical protein